VFFNTGDSLVPTDIDGTTDAYEFDTLTGQVHLLSSGRAGSSGSYFLDASADGRDVFFITRDQLVGWDVDAQFDMYDARVEGGLPGPAPEALGCVGDGCQGLPATGPGLLSPGSALVAGAGNLKSATPAAKPIKPVKRKAHKRAAKRKKKKKGGAKRRRVSVKRVAGKAGR
jgi:hypothetical protein